MSKSWFCILNLVQGCWVATITEKGDEVNEGLIIM